MMVLVEMVQMDLVVKIQQVDGLLVVEVVQLMMVLQRRLELVDHGVIQIHL